MPGPCENFLKSLDKRHWIAIDLDEKIRGYWLMRTSNLTERENSGIKIITQGQTQLAQVKKTITQPIVAKKREEVRDDLREAGDRARWKQ